MSATRGAHEPDLGAAVSIGTLVGSDFRIERELGRGGMGVIYVARQLSTGRARALKMMNPSLVRSDEMRRRFEQEARVGSRIQSEHVVEVIAAGIDARSGMPWIAMELLEGEDLHAYVEREGALGLDRASHVLAQLFHALDAAHRVGVVHRDLKPENVFLTRSRREGAPLTVKLLDLGIAKIVADAHSGDTASVGTPLWMAPEQAGGSIGPATDVWAIGLLAFWMLTGKSYWLTAESDTPVMGILREMFNEPMERASARAHRLGSRIDLPGGFDAWFDRCVARDPDARYADAGQARQAFERIASGSAETIAIPSSAAILTKARARISRVGVAIVAVAAVLFVSAAGWRATRSRSAPAISAPAASASGEILVAISVSPSDARLTLDGKRLDQNPFVERKPRDGSPHHVRADASGHKPIELEVSYDADVALDLVLDALAAPVPFVVPAPSQRSAKEIVARAPANALARPSASLTPTSLPAKSAPAPPEPDLAARPAPTRSTPPIDKELPWNEKQH